MKLEQTEDGLFLKVLTDEQGHPQFDIRCPVHCGSCCSYWKDVPALANLPEADPRVWFECPNLGDEGCKLPRIKRPFECLAYVCELSILAIEKLVTDEEIEKVCDESRQNDAFEFLGKHPKEIQGKLTDLKVRAKDRRKFKKIMKEREESVRNAKEACLEISYKARSGD